MMVGGQGCRCSATLQYRGIHRPQHQSAVTRQQHGKLNASARSQPVIVAAGEMELTLQITDLLAGEEKKKRKKAV